jgi:hypothetical protein
MIAIIAVIWESWSLAANQHKQRELIIKLPNYPITKSA